jgi:hypothetical protein
MSMHSHLKGLPALLLSVVLAGCSAAPAPCLIQRVLLGGYTMRFDLKGAAPAGCEATLPQTFGDNWTFEAYPDGTVGVTSDRIQNGADPDPSHVGIGKGKLTATEPDAQSYCYVTDVSEMRGDVNPFNLPPGQERLSYVTSKITLLDGANYQGSTFEAEVSVTVGTCTGSYVAQALTPSQVPRPCSDDTTCDPNPDPANGRPAGSGINSDYAVACQMAPWITDLLVAEGADPGDVAGQGICFFTKPFPGLK